MGELPIKRLVEYFANKLGLRVFVAHKPAVYEKYQVYSRFHGVSELDPNKVVVIAPPVLGQIICDSSLTVPNRYDDVPRHRFKIQEGRRPYFLFEAIDAIKWKQAKCESSLLKAIPSTQIRAVKKDKGYTNDKAKMLKIGYEHPALACAKCGIKLKVYRGAYDADYGNYDRTLQDWVCDTHKQ
jgi:hypothetical protein